MQPTDIDALCRERRWTRARLIHELRTATRTQKLGELPTDDSLKRMIRQWISGTRSLSAFYAELLTAVFGIPFRVGDGASQQDDQDVKSGELAHRLAHTATVVDSDLIKLLETQTDTIRGLDRRLGAARLIPQTRAHVEQMTDLLTYSLPGGLRPRLAEATAEAASLAAWQALDLGDIDRAWLLYETAKTAAKDSGDASALAYVTAEQGYVLIDAGRPDLASNLIRSAHEDARSGVPHVLRAWLWAAEAEASAASEDEDSARRALDEAASELSISGGERLPYVFLNEVHLARWRGHCLARLGSSEAVNDLGNALDDLDPTFTRAAAGLHCDLALAYSQRGEHDAARTEARAAQRLADQTASARQRRRISRLLSSGGDDAR